MVATIIRRQSPRLIKRKYRRELIDVSKTGISNIDVVNEAIDAIVTQSQGSGTGTSTSAATTIPRLLKKRREKEQETNGNDNNNDNKH
jgi:hypothetical protein